MSKDKRRWQVGDVVRGPMEGTEWVLTRKVNSDIWECFCESKGIASTTGTVWLDTATFVRSEGQVAGQGSKTLAWKVGQRRRGTKAGMATIVVRKHLGAGLWLCDRDDGGTGLAYGERWPNELLEDAATEECGGHTKFFADYQTLDAGHERLERAIERAKDSAYSATGIISIMRCDSVLMGERCIRTAGHDGAHDGEARVFPSPVSAPAPVCGVGIRNSAYKCNRRTGHTEPCEWSSGRINGISPPSSAAPERKGGKVSTSPVTTGNCSRITLSGIPCDLPVGHKERECQVLPKVKPARQWTDVSWRRLDGTMGVVRFDRNAEAVAFVDHIHAEKNTRTMTDRHDANLRTQEQPKQPTEGYESLFLRNGGSRSPW